MKKFLFSLVAAASLATTGVGIVQSNPAVLAARRTAVKSYHFDKNTITHNESHFCSYRYIRIPARSRQVGYQNQQIGGGWNYKRYLHTNFYSGGY